MSDTDKYNDIFILLDSIIGITKDNFFLDIYNDMLKNNVDTEIIILKLEKYIRDNALHFRDMRIFLTHELLIEFESLY